MWQVQGVATSLATNLATNLAAHLPINLAAAAESKFNHCCVSAIPGLHDVRLGVLLELPWSGELQEAG